MRRLRSTKNLDGTSLFCTRSKFLLLTLEQRWRPVGAWQGKGVEKYGRSLGTSLVEASHAEPATLGSAGTPDRSTATKRVHMRPLCIIWRRCLPKRRDAIKGFLDGDDRLCSGSIDGSNRVSALAGPLVSTNLCGGSNRSRAPMIGNRPPTPIGCIDEETNCRSVCK